MSVFDLLTGLVGFAASTAVWVLAASTYGRFIREDVRGFRRVVAFMLGFPWTIFVAALHPGPSKEDVRRRLQGEMDERHRERALLDEIRADRESRGLPPVSGPVADGETHPS